MRRTLSLSTPRRDAALLGRHAGGWLLIAMAAISVCACATTQPQSARGARGAGSGRGAAGAPADAQAGTTSKSSRSPLAGAAVGTAGPVVVEAAGPNGRWSAVCQAREDTDRNGKLRVRYGPRGKPKGDAMRSYFVLGAGRGEAIDGLATYDRTGRYVVLVVDGELVMVDTVTHQRTNLSAAGADARWDGGAFADHRAVSFSPTGSKLAYVRADPAPTRRKHRDKLVIMQLPSGVTRVIDPGPGAIHRVRFLPGGRQIAVHVVAEDTNRNGRLDWPVPEVATNRWRCHGPVTTFPVWVDTGDRTVTRLVSVQEGQARAIGGWVAPLGAGHVVRGPQDELVFVRGASRSLLTDSDCAGRVLHVDPPRGLALVACSGAGVRAPVFLVGPGRRTDLELQVPATDLDHIPDRLPRLVPLYPGNDTVVVDLDAGVVVHLEPGDDVVHTQGTTAIVRRGKRLVARDCVSGREQRLDVSVRRLGDALVTGSALYVPPVILRLSSDGTVKLLGRAPAQVLGLSDKGYVLVATRSGTVAAPANGPLRWTAPKALGRP